MHFELVMGNHIVTVNYSTQIYSWKLEDSLNKLAKRFKLSKANSNYLTQSPGCNTLGYEISGVRLLLWNEKKLNAMLNAFISQARNIFGNHNRSLYEISVSYLPM